MFPDIERKRILIVDDDSIMRESLKETLKRNPKYVVATAVNAKDALEKLPKRYYHLALVDLRMPKINGIELLEHIKRVSPQTMVIVMTAYGTIESAVKAMKAGAFDYLTKPFSVDEVEVVVEKTLEHQKVVEENRYLREEISERYNFGNIVGESERMKEVYELITKVAKSDATVLIQGESGTGKELVARAIHFNSPRAKGPFIKINCAAIPSTLLESELFGYERGAFTNAFTTKPGRFELADRGTLLLDEISEMELPLQAKLLRVLQEGEFDRIGGIRPIKADIRIIATTNKDLWREVREGNFREDLYYRLNVLPICLPPLRERKEDIPLLVNHFIDRYSRKNGKKINGIDKKVTEALKEYDWPGNVRELENSIERAIVLTTTDYLTQEHFSFIFEHIKKRVEIMRGANKERECWNELSKDINGGQLTLPQIELKTILRALARSGGDTLKAARLLGITTRILVKKLRDLEEFVSSKDIKLPR